MSINWDWDEYGAEAKREMNMDDVDRANDEEIKQQREAEASVGNL